LREQVTWGSDARQTHDGEGGREVLVSGLHGSLNPSVPSLAIMTSLVVVMHRYGILADIPMTNTGSEISAYTDSQSNIQLCSNFLPFEQFYGQFSHFVILPIADTKGLAR